MDHNVSPAAHEEVASDIGGAATLDAGGGADTAKWLESPSFTATQDLSLADIAVRTAVGTALALAICTATIWLSRRRFQATLYPGAGSVSLELLATIPLGNRSCLQLIRTGRQKVIVGSDSGGLKSVLVLPDLFLDEVDEQTDARDGSSLAQEGDTIATSSGPGV